jgi:hypothetical protein
MYSATVMFPLKVEVRASRLFTARALVYEENMASMVSQASATVFFAAIWMRTSLETYVRRKLRTYWSAASQSS